MNGPLLDPGAIVIGTIGFIWWSLTGDLALTALLTGGLLMYWTFMVPARRRRPRTGKRWTWGGGLIIPPFFVGGWRRGDDEETTVLRG